MEALSFSLIKRRRVALCSKHFHYDPQFFVSTVRAT
jgi:hypothetical protein